jgi:hypothetical protein
MIKNPSYSGKVRIDEEKNTGAFSGKGNPHSVSNVNQKQGPRTGNSGTLTKRTDFVAAKQERAPLADVVTSAFATRGKGRAESIAATEQVGDNTNVKFKKK